MRWGFKTEADRIACRLRSELKLAKFAPLPARTLLAHLEIVLLQPSDIPELRPETLHRVMNGASAHWSAITFYDASRRPLIIHNPKHALSRQESDLMHEAAHILCNHKPAKIVNASGCTFRTYDPNQEKEAEWLGGCLQITRDGLLWAIRRQMTNDRIAEHFCASPDMVRFRRNTTGVDTQIARLRHFRQHR